MTETFLMRMCVVIASSVLITFSASAQTIDIAKDYYLARILNSHESEKMRDALKQYSNGELKAAMATLQEFSSNGDLEARYILARFHDVGAGVDKSAYKSESLFQQNIESGHLPSMVSYADKIREKSPAQTLQLYKMAANKGDVVASVRLGEIYENGKFPGTRVNRRLALKYFRRAAVAEIPFAKFKLAGMYAAGKGVSLNDLQANRLYSKAALSGVPAANTEMAKRYFAGKGVNPDPVAAVGWLTRGAQMGHTEAMVILGKIYQAGEFVKRDLNMAGQLYSAATKANDLQGRYRLALLYYEGIGTAPDIVRAFVLLHNAQGLPKAKELYTKIGKEMTPEQLRFAQEKLKNPANQSP